MLFVATEEWHALYDWQQFCLHGATWVLLVCAASKRPLIDLTVGFSLLLCLPPIGAASVLCVFAYTPLFFAAQKPSSRTDVFVTGFLLAVLYAHCLTGWSTVGLRHPPIVSVLLVLYSCAITVPMVVALHLCLACRCTKIRPLAILVIPLLELVRVRLPVPLPYHLSASMTANCLFVSQLVELVDFWGLAIAICGMSYIGLITVNARFASNCDKPFNVSSIRRNCIALIALVMVLNSYGVIRRLTFEAESDRTLVAVIGQEYNPRGLPHPHHDRANRLGSAIESGLKEAVEHQSREGEDVILFLPEGAMAAPWVDENGWTRVPTGVLTAIQIAENEQVRKTKPPIVSGITIPTSQSKSRHSIAVLLPPHYKVTEDQIRDKLLAAPIGESAPFAEVPILNHLGQLIAESDVAPDIRNPNASLSVSDDLHIAVAICFEHVFPNIWRHRNLHDLEDVHLQTAFASMRWFNYSQLEREQSRAVRRLFAIRDRRPFLYVSSGGSEWIDVNGDLRDFVPAQATHAVFRLPLPRDPNDSWCEVMLQSRRVAIPQFLFSIAFLLLGVYFPFCHSRSQSSFR